MEGFTSSGRIEWHRDIADSGNPMARGFCPACGTPLFVTSERRPHLITVRLGTFDDGGQLAPEATIWADAAPPWAPIDPALPRIAGQPAPPR